MSTQVPREKAIFCQALEIADPEQRRKFVEQACGVDKALREQVDRLLALSPSAGSIVLRDAAGLLRRCGSHVLHKFRSPLDRRHKIP